MCTRCPTSGRNMCTRWASYTGRASLLLAFTGPVWGPVRALCMACMGLR